MKNILLVILFISTVICGQDRLSFVNDTEIKIEMQKSIDYLNHSQVISKDI